MSFRPPDLSILLQHEHGDGSWGRFEPRPTPHDAADHDLEREWPRGTIYKCTTCDDELVVSAVEDPDEEPHGGVAPEFQPQ